MRGSDDRAHARLVPCNRGKTDSLREDAFPEQRVRELHGQRRIAHDDRRDRTLARARVEAERLEAALEDARVLPEALDELRLAFEHVDRGEGGPRPGPPGATG